MAGRIEVVEQRLAKGEVVAGRYRLERVVGVGGMGVVWAATDTTSGEVRALKFLKDADHENERAHVRLIREARAASTVRHANIAPVLEVGELENGQPFLVMELLDGETLGARLGRGGPLDLDETARIMLQVVSAVEAAHAHGIVHRDLKPDNIFLLASGGDDDVRVLDFGIAKDVAPDAGESTSLTATGAMIGTPHYMAPEQIFGDRDIDARADVWALGVILYECVTGRRPTEGSGVGQVLKIIMTDSIPRLASVAPEAPSALSDLLAGMLTRDRAARPSLEIVRRALEGLEGGGSVAPAVAPARDAPTLDTHDSAPRRASTPTAAKSRSGALWWAGAAALVVGGFGWYVTAHFSTPSLASEALDAAPAPILDALAPDEDVAIAPDLAHDVARSDAGPTATPGPTPAPRRAPGAVKDAGAEPRAQPSIAGDAGVSASGDGGTSVNILSHDRT